MLSVLTLLRGRTPPFGSKGFPFAFPGRSHDTRRDARTFRTELVEVRQRHIRTLFDAVCEPRHRPRTQILFLFHVRPGDLEHLSQELFQWLGLLDVMTLMSNASGR